jgi:hypothetical protein
VTFTNSRWLKPIDRFREDLYLYRRGDALDKRRNLMDAWAAYCEPQRLDNVVSMGRKNRK